MNSPEKLQNSKDIVMNNVYKKSLGLIKIKKMPISKSQNLGGF